MLPVSGPPLQLVSPGMHVFNTHDPVELQMLVSRKLNVQSTLKSPEPSKAPAGVQSALLCAIIY
jgi:hypothetical protein